MEVKAEGWAAAIVVVIVMFLIAGVILVCPLAGIFALRLLGLAIPYTIHTWCGMLILLVLFGASARSSK